MPCKLWIFANYYYLGELNRPDPRYLHYYYYLGELNGPFNRPDPRYLHHSHSCQYRGRRNTPGNYLVPQETYPGPL